MKNNRIVWPIYSKIILSTLDLIFIITIIKSIYNNENLRISQIIYILCLLFFFLFLTFHVYIVYILNEDDILIKYPFGNHKVYYTNDIIGFTFYQEPDDNYLNFKIYFNKKILNFPIIGKNSDLIVKQFYNNNYEKIKERNISKIINGFIEIIIKYNLKIKFSKNKIEILKNNNIFKVYCYDDIKTYKIKELFMMKNITLFLKDGNRILLRNNKCMGGIGLFDYLLEKIKCGNVA